MMKDQSHETFSQTNQKPYYQKTFDPSLLQISINQTMVKESTDSKPYTEYLIQVSYENKKWSVSRKYKSFCELNQYLISEFPSTKLPDSSYVIQGAVLGNTFLPNSKRPTVIEERRKALQQYLRDLAQIERIANSAGFQDFLEIGRNCNVAPVTIEERQPTLTHQSSRTGLGLQREQSQPGYPKNKENFGKYTPEKGDYDPRRISQSSSQKEYDDDRVGSNRKEQLSPGIPKNWYDKPVDSSKMK
jgi:hypothetical protein